jgi:hypothetical protein
MVANCPPVVSISIKSLRAGEEFGFITRGSPEIDGGFFHAGS